jgi:hypothetical protein
MFTIKFGGEEKAVKANNADELNEEVRKAFGYKDFQLHFNGYEFTLRKETKRLGFHYNL